MLKFTVACLFLVLAPLVALANEPKYTSETAREFFFNKENVAIVMRIDGGIDPSVYWDHQEIWKSELPDETVEQWHKYNSRYSSSNFLVMKNIKGELPPIFAMPNDYFNQGLIDLSRPYLVFLEPPVNDLYTLETGEAFPLDKLEDVVITLDSEALLEYVVERKLGIEQEFKISEGPPR